MVEGEGELTQLKNNNSRKEKTMEYDLAKIGGNRDASDKAVLDCLLPFFFLTLKEATRIYTQTKAIAKSGVLCYNLFCRGVPETEFSGE